MVNFINTPFQLNAANYRNAVECSYPCGCLPMPDSAQLIQVATESLCNINGGKWVVRENGFADCPQTSYCMKPDQNVCQQTPEAGKVTSCFNSGGFWGVDNCGCECPIGKHLDNGICVKDSGLPSQCPVGCYTKIDETGKCVCRGATIYEILFKSNDAGDLPKIIPITAIALVAYLIFKK